MQILLGTTPEQIKGDSSRPVIQNLGPGIVYLDTDPEVTVDSGIKLAVGTVYEFPTAGSLSIEGIFIVADTADTDVRVMDAG